MNDHGFPTQRMHYDPDGDKVIIEHIQDVEPYLEANKEAQKVQAKDNDTWGRHIGSIPNIIIMRWLKDDGVFLLALRKHEMRAYLRRKLNDPDWRHLKTTPGKI